MQTILVPTDFSKNADNALYYAIGLAKKEKARLFLVHAYHVTIIAPDVPIQYLTEEMAFAEKKANTQMKDLFAKIKSEKIECEYIINQGIAVDLIIDMANKIKPAFIVMGTKGTSGIKEIIMGSNTAKVIARAKCPVIAIPEKSRFSPIKHIVYATNYMASDIDALEKVIEIAKLFKSKITLLHISDEEFNREDEAAHINKFKEKVKARFGYEKLQFELLYGDNFTHTVENYIKHHSTDLLALSTHYRNLYDKLFGSSNTQKLAYYTKVPLLAFHFKKESVVFI